MFIKTLLASVTLASLGAVPAHAVGIAGQGTWQQTLLGRDLDGNLGNGPEAWYDTTLNITWLANTQAIAGTPYDTYFRGGSDDQPYDNESNETDGRAVLSDAFFWVQQLNVGGTTGWRLPATTPIDGSDFRYSPSTKAAGEADTPWRGVLDVGWNITSMHSELAHMFHITLGNLGAYDNDGRLRDPGEISFNTGVFDALKARKIWSGSKYHPNERDIAWVFDFASGKQQGGYPALPFPEAYHAWAVHDGDVGMAMPVPEPASWAVLLAGLAVVLTSASGWRGARRQ